MKQLIVILIAAFSLCLGAAGKTKTVAKPAFAHPWTGKRVAYIGDSVSDPNLKQGEDMKHYWDYLAEWLDITPIVYAVSGHTLMNGFANLERLHNEHGDSVDAVVVFLGTNDFNMSLPLGTTYIEEDAEVERAAGYPKRKDYTRRRTPALTDKTICGRINLVMQRMKTLYPTRQLVFLTPLHRGYAKFGENNVQPDESYSNLQGNYIGDVAQAIVEAGRVWSVPVVDLYALCGLLPNLPAHDIYIFNPARDRLHPNELGHERIAKTIMQQTLTLPVY
ncbi:MAG: SGNH/GDSL hydrolase family protein [Bacteroidaceae bacterium]|nr:SGNH/GDSL hydrolase family protein [Bacteroidaceae bacterium]